MSRILASFVQWTLFSFVSEKEESIYKWPANHGAGSITHRSDHLEVSAAVLRSLWDSGSGGRQHAAGEDWVVDSDFLMKTGSGALELELRESFTSNVFRVPYTGIIMQKDAVGFSCGSTELRGDWVRALKRVTVCVLLGHGTLTARLSQKKPVCSITARWTEKQSYVISQRHQSAFICSKKRQKYIYELFCRWLIPCLTSMSASAPWRLSWSLHQVWNSAFTRIPWCLWLVCFHQYN